MPRTVKQRIKRRVAYRLARIIHPVFIAYLDLYHEADESEDDSGENKQRIDLTGSTGGQFEVAANRDHSLLDVEARRFGFGPPDRRV